MPTLEELTATPDNSPKMRANDAKLNFMVNGIVTSQRGKSNDVVLCGNEIGWWLATGKMAQTMRETLLAK